MHVPMNTTLSRGGRGQAVGLCVLLHLLRGLTRSTEKRIDPPLGRLWVWATRSHSCGRLLQCTAVRLMPVPHRLFTVSRIYPG